ncbi:MAG TPA: efflux RND transporter periplasmic adaptor subunit [Candidatus Limnocylindria bacterium]|nr:efflux RND transporter periplasmic adaptor subunit [Candidatus Limnocylindria bacterium]
MSTSPPDLSRLRIDRDDAPPSGGGSRGRRWWLFGIAGAGAIAVTAFLLAPRATEVQIAVAEATGGGSAGGSGITANGYVVARTKASVSAKIPGRLAYLGVSEGSRVRKGHVIARIENADYRAALQAAEATAKQIDVELVQARRDLDRARTLRADQVIAETDLERATTRVDGLAAQLNASRAQSALARANLENTNVRAPFDGTILRKDAEVGEIVAPSSAGGGLTRTAIVTMADLGTLEVEVDVNEAYIAQVRNGQDGRITLDAYPDTSFVGRVRQVVPTADRQKATVQVKVSILDRDPRILPEMGAKVEFVRPAGDAAAPIATVRRVMVPAEAVNRGPNGTRVWVVEGGKVDARAVEIGRTRGDRVEIRSGLSGGENLVVNPPADLEDGAKVRVRT